MNYPSIRIEGSIVSPELFDRLDELPGQRPADFGLTGSATVKDEIARAWADAQDYWRIFHRKLETMPTNVTGTTETRNLWIVPLLGLLGYQLEYQQRGPELNAKVYPISHRASNRADTPVHIIGYRDAAGLDRKPERSGGPRMSAHALVQEYLNLSEQLYAVVTNGRLLRLLRDSSRLVKLTYLEFDLDRILTDGLFADFAVLYRLLHASRLSATPDGVPNSLIERYHQDSVESGARIRDGLSFAVEKTLQDLANGFLAHSRNDTLRAAIINGQLSAPAFYQNLLRLVYRLLFLFVVEERDLVYPKDSRTKRDLYYRYYSLQRIRSLAKQQYLFDRRHSDAWFAVLACFRLFESGGSGDKLGISPLAGHLFNQNAIGPLRDAYLDNATVLSAFAELCTFQHPDTNLPTTVNYGALATEEFGSVYERLLELHPVFQNEGDLPRFTFKQAAGNERKTTGSYYTPSSLVECLLDSALDPVVEQRLKGKNRAETEQAILSLKVCDPAVGSGHFLIAAGHRLARRLATLRAGDDEPSPDQLRHALREVIGHCLYGVDVNPMSVELCKVTLWLEAMEPGKPLSFLDHHIQCGNSLLGATPRVLTEGLPDDAFKPLNGDDPEICREAKARNKDERKQLALFHGTETAPWNRLGALPAAMLEVDSMNDETAAALIRKEERYAELVRSTDYLHSRFLADAWCAAFVWKKTRDLPYPITNDVLHKIERNSHDCAPWMRDEIVRLRDLNHYFHWHLAFPEVFPVPKTGETPANTHTGWNGGFDVIIGNPPWERVTLKEKEWFATRDPWIASASTGAERQRRIMELRERAPGLLAAFVDAKRLAAGEKSILCASGLYPLCGQGDVNTFAVFAEIGFRLSKGRVGMVLPTGIVTADTTQDFIAELVRSGRLVSLFDFDNRGGLFPAVQGNVRFCLLTTAEGPQPEILAAAQLQSTDGLSDPNRVWSLMRDDVVRINPNTLTLPLFPSQRDAAIVRGIYSRCRGLDEIGAIYSGRWNVGMQRMLHMGDDSHLFMKEEQLIRDGFTKVDEAAWTNGVVTYIPLLEAKLCHQFDHRAGTFDGVPLEERFGTHPATREVTLDEHANPRFGPEPRYWVLNSEIRTRIGRAGYLLAFRDAVSAVADSRSLVATIIPPHGAGHTLQFLYADSAKEAVFLCSWFNSFAVDFIFRLKASGAHASFFLLRQLPIPSRDSALAAAPWDPTTAVMNWILPRVLELTYTAWDLGPFARDCGWSGPPFVWDEARRFQLRCELDAAFLHLYGLNRDEAAYILETFPIIRRKDEAAYGTYQTKDTILALYDQLAEAQRSGKPFSSALNPAPGDRQACHPRRRLAILAFGSLRQDPGKIGEHVALRIATETPFGVEYGRLSQSRGGGPTLVPHDKGAKVEAELLVLPDTMTVAQARDLLWRRERRKEDGDETYSAGTGPNAVLVKQWAAGSEWEECPWVETVLYTDFNSAGKQTLAAETLAAAAIESVRAALPGKDGISYLEEATAHGINTPLTDSYVTAVLRQTGAVSLSAARIFAKTGQLPVVQSVELKDASKAGGKRSRKVKAPKMEPAPALELNLGLDVFDNVVAHSRSWEDAPFAIPAGLRHGALPEELYARQWLFALFALNPAGLTGSHISDSFRLLLNKDSRKLAAQSGDKQGGTWAKAFNQPVQLATFLAALLQRAANHELILQKDGNEIRLKPSPGWSESPSDWLKADAEITQRALRDKELHSQLLPFIAPIAEVTAFNQALAKMA